MGMPRKLPHLPHAAVDWQTLFKNENGKEFVRTVCPTCGIEKIQNARCVAGRIRKGTFSGYCYLHRKMRHRTRIAAYPEHPCVDWLAMSPHVSKNGTRLRYVSVTCPKCGIVRWCKPGPIANKIENNRFTGTCRSCSTHFKGTSWGEISPGRKIDPNKGYVRISRGSVPIEHQHIWDALAQKNSGAVRVVTEHRFVMSVVLGRPLTSKELVDHMDGVKTNNDPSNLRIYRRGKNEPGETSGYGTYYHEWQMALAEIERLRALL